VNGSGSCAGRRKRENATEMSDPQKREARTSGAEIARDPSGRLVVPNRRIIPFPEDVD